VLLGLEARASYRATSEVRLDPLGLATVTIPPELEHADTVIVGDSRAAGWPTPPGVLNVGVYAQTTAQVRARFSEHVLARHPRTVWIEAGMNDLKVIGTMPEARRAIVEGCVANLRAMVDSARAARAEVVLVTVIPSGHVPLVRRAVWSADIDAAVREVNAALHAFAGPGVRVLDATAVLADASGHVRSEYQLDTLHLNDAGYAALLGAGGALADGAQKSTDDPR
jgi:lysophospholipase L1-like esterase